jgi:hypothetical protein
VGDIQLALEPRVPDSDRKLCKALRGDDGFEILGEQSRNRQLAGAELGGDFRGRGCAHGDAAGFVLYCQLGARAQGLVNQAGAPRTR